MAEEKKSAVETPNGAPKDPITEGSLLWPIFLSMIALLLSTAWALYDEGWTRREYKRYQSEWLPVARSAYRSKLYAAEQEDVAVRSSETFIALETALREAEAESRPKGQAFADALSKEVNPRLAVLSWPVKVTKSEVAALVYRYEHAKAGGHDAEAQRYFARLEKIKNTKHKIRFPAETETREMNYQEMSDEFSRLKSMQGAIQGEMAVANRPADEARARLNAYREAQMQGPSPDTLKKLVASLDEFIPEIKQIHAQGADGELIERCESCHLGIRSPVELSLADVKGKKEYTSHPKKELLEIHNPETFGCSTCHGGLGIAVANPKRAHGHFKHSVSPMHYPENIEAGCVRCHQDDIHLEHGNLFNEGKQIFFTRGCWGCHPYDGFGREGEELKLLDQSIETATRRVSAAELDVARLAALAADESTPVEQIEGIQAKKGKVELELHLIESELKQAQTAKVDLDLEVKRVGPNLKELKSKLKGEWLHSWLMDPRAFRPDTKMPRFRLDDEKAWDIAAYLWQNSAPVPVAELGEGDADNGQRLVITRGCLGCHKVSTDDFETIGAGWAADLSRLGEKANPAYIASWVKNPKYHNKYTVMPSLRLSDSDARDIAAWLATKTKEGAQYPAAAEVDPILGDTARFERGKKLVQHLGCAGCHEIKGLENEGRIGVDLTEEGSKPIERLDFGTQTHDFKHMPDPRHPGRKKQYDHKGFFENKLRKPEIWDKGKLLPSYWDRLKMPAFWLGENEPGYTEAKADIGREIDAVTTFLIGSLERLPPPLGPPDRLYYDPKGAQKDLQDGWWVVKKYNCDGCHQIQAGMTPEIWKLPIYQDGTGYEGVPDRNGRPPTLVGQGSRTDPMWLSSFLANPSLTTDPSAQTRNGVRQGLAVRMPTFELSERERMKLVRFFLALESLSTDYVRPEMSPLSAEELDIARAAFTGGDCANCHLLGGEATINSNTTYAPSFLPVAHRIRPSWVKKWVTTPSAVIPGTAMPAILKQIPKDGGGQRWVIDVNGLAPTPKARVSDERLKKLGDYQGDHAELLMRYFAQWTAEESAFQKAAREK